MYRLQYKLMMIEIGMDFERNSANLMSTNQQRLRTKRGGDRDIPSESGTVLEAVGRVRSIAFSAPLVPSSLSLVADCSALAGITS